MTRVRAPATTEAVACAEVEVEGPGEGVGGTTVGVAGCSATRAIPRDDVAGDAMLLFAGCCRRRAS